MCRSKLRILVLAVTIAVVFAFQGTARAREQFCVRRVGETRGPVAGVLLPGDSAGSQIALGGWRWSYFSELCWIMRRFFMLSRRFLHSEDGLSAVEYALVLALIVVGCVVSITALGSRVTKTFKKQAKSADAGWNVSYTRPFLLITGDDSAEDKRTTSAIRFQAVSNYPLLARRTKPAIGLPWYTGKRRPSAS
jgi:pilus assembly protein Flp/PilA